MKILRILVCNVDICSIRESFPREEDPWSRSWTPLCYEGQYYPFIQVCSHFNFLSGVEKGKHCAEEEDHRAHKDGAAGI